MDITETQIVGAYKRGESVIDISHKYDVSKMKVYRILEKHNVPRKTVNSNTKDRVINSLKLGHSIEDIMEKNRCSLSYVYKIKKKYITDKTTIPSTKKSLISARDIQTDYNDGVSVKTISKKYGMSESTIYRMLKIHVGNIVTYFVIKPEFDDGTYLSGPQPLGYFISQNIELEFLNPVIYDFKPLTKRVIEIDEIVDKLNNHRKNVFRVGIIGPKYIGKSHLAKRINDQVGNSVVHSFAEPIKQEINYYERIKTTPKEVLREELIELSERKKVRNPRYWVDKALNKPLDNGVKTIIYDDVRFIPEAIEMDMLIIIDGPFSNAPSERGFLQKEINHFKKQGVKVYRYRGDL